MLSLPSEPSALLWFRRCGAAALWRRQPELYSACSAGSRFCEDQYRLDIRHDCARSGTLCESAEQLEELERILTTFITDRQLDFITRAQLRFLNIVTI